MEYKRLTKRNEHGEARHAIPLKGQYIREIDEEAGKRDAAVLRRLCELEEKIEQGTLIELPCKVGDTVYVIYQYIDFLGTEEEPFIEEDIAKLFIYDENKMKIVTSGYGERSEYWYKVLDILLTREEAEKRLKELQNG